MQEYHQSLKQDMILQYIYVKIYKVFKSISNELSNAICGTFLKFEIFIMRKRVQLGLRAFDIFKHDCVKKKKMKLREMFFN